MNAQRAVMEWHRFLKSLHLKYGVIGCVAGGCLRDLHNGRPIKDVDVFVYIWDDGGLNAFGLDALANKGVNHIHYGPLGRDGEVKITFDIKDGPWTYNLVFMDMSKGFDLRSIVERIDFGCCQIGFDLSKQFYSSPYFEHDTKRRQFVYRLPGPVDKADLERSKRRWERLQAKYPDWTASFPE